MKNKNYILIFIIITCLVFGLCLMVMSDKNSGYLKKLGVDNYGNVEYNDRICGPSALYVALGRLGGNVTIKEVINSLYISENGVSFGDLQANARMRGYRTKLAKISWEELIGLNTTSVLWLNKNHFVAVDSREIDHDRIRMYDVKCAAKWMTRDELKKIWSGETLIVWNKEIADNRKGARVLFNTVINDFGFCYSEDSSVVEFEFKNTGQSPLVTKVGKVGCGCMSAILDKEEVAPGDVGKLKVAIDLDRKRGYFTSTILLETNDENNPKCVLRVSGDVKQKNICRTPSLLMGNIVQGKTKKRCIYIHDRGDKSLRVNSAKLKLDGPIVDYIKTNVNVIPYVNGVEIGDAVVSYNVQNGDYKVEVELKIAQNAPCGTYEGLLLVETNQNAEEELPLKFMFRVESDIISEPGIVIFTDKKPNVQLLLKSLSGKHFEMVGTPQIIGDLDVNLTKLENDNDGLRYSLNINFDSTSMSMLDRGEVVFNVQEHGIIKVPILLVQRKTN